MVLTANQGVNTKYNVLPCLPSFVVLAAQVKIKYDHSNSNGTQKEHVPTFLLIPPPSKALHASPGELLVRRCAGRKDSASTYFSSSRHPPIPSNCTRYVLINSELIPAVPPTAINWRSFGGCPDLEILMFLVAAQVKK
jgi:hypothetical protein